MTYTANDHHVGGVYRSGNAIAFTRGDDATARTEAERIALALNLADSGATGRRGARFYLFDRTECELIADGLDILQPDNSDEGARADAVRIELHAEAYQAAVDRREAEIAEERARDYRETLEAEAEKLLKANGFKPELGGGGCLIQSRHWPNGAYIWATNESGLGSEPTATHFCVCVYGVDADGNMTEPLIDLRGKDENGGHDHLFLVDAIRIAVKAAEAVDALLAKHNAGDGPCTEEDQRGAAEAIEAAEAGRDRPYLIPEGFRQWSEVCQGATVRQVNERGGVHICDLTGQESGDEFSWSVSVFVGLWDFDGEADWPHEPVYLIHTINMGAGVSFDVALAGALAMAEALPEPAATDEPEECDNHLTDGRGLCRTCRRPL